MRAIAASELLTLWEQGALCHPLDRSALLCACARPDLPVDAIVDLPLGEVGSSLLTMIATCFGDRIDAHVSCPHCGERLSLSLPVRELAATTASARAVNAAGFRCRLPSLRDLAALAREPQVHDGAQFLLARCIDADVGALDDAQVREIEDALERADPGADLEFSLQCAACGAAAQAQLDPAEVLWDEIESSARSLLGEIDALARAYGWDEREILALGARRRASYLSMVAP
jgi:hypothetical protein